MTVTFTTEPVDREDGRTLKVTRRCEICGGDIVVFVEPGAFAEFAAGGGFVQTLFPYLSADERELLLNGFCGPCFNSFCPPDED